MILNIDKIKEKKIKKFLISLMKYKTVHSIPKLKAIVVNTDLGTELDKNYTFMTNSKNVLQDITLQMPKIISAKKSISNFKLKEGEKIALMCTLQCKRLNFFLTKLVFLVLPQIENWKTLNKLSKFDKQYNFNFGIDEHLVFPEIGFAFNLKPFGLNININFTKQKKDYVDRWFFLKLMKITL